MKTERTYQMEAELRDPMMTALLTDVYADDPALAPSPGRTERIMRRVMTAGVQPARRPFAWGGLGWALGACAAAGLLLALGLGMTTRMLNNTAPQVAEYVAPTPAPQTPNLTPEPRHDVTPPSAPVVVPDIKERTAEAPPVPKRPKYDPPLSPRTPPRDVPTPPVPPVTPDQPDVATVAYVAPESLYVEGKYHEAAEAWFARYQQAGNPDDLIANADALNLAPLPAEG